MDPRYLSRLQEEQKKAISETETRIYEIKQMKEDYRALQDKLKTLPDRTTYDVVVSFGKFAVMHGQLVHTNEIQVLLGLNWFVERSAKQSIEIVGRRIKEIDKTLKDLEAQRKLLEPRLSFTSNLQAELQGRGDVKEIVEVYDEEKEKLWDEQHRKNMKKYYQEIQRDVKPQSHQEKKEMDEQKTDLSFWSRLDELERQETELGEMDSMSNEDEEEIERFHSNVGSDKSSFADRRVSWADEMKDENTSIEKSDDDSDDDYNDEDEADNEDDNDETDITGKALHKVITFTHSPAPGMLPHQVHEAAEDSGIHSPGDIYRLFSPKSILKKTCDTGVNLESLEISECNSSRLENRQSSDPVLEAGSQVSFSDMEKEEQSWFQPSSQQILSSKSSAGQAFTGFVVEKSQDLPTTAAVPTEAPTSSVTMVASTATPVNTSDEPAKRVSKFKASRLHQNPL